MCWSLPVSVGFTVLEFLFFIAIAYKRVKVWILPLLFSIIMVEFAEAMIWSTLPDSNEHTHTHTQNCETLNESGMWIIVVAVRLQPLFFYLPAFNNGELVSPWIVLRKIGCGVASAATLILFIEAFGCSGRCAMKDVVSGHLDWRSLEDCAWELPKVLSYLIYFVPIAFGFTLHAFPENIFLILFIILFFILHAINSNISYSMWCWTGILIHIFYFFLTWFNPQETQDEQIDHTLP